MRALFKLDCDKISNNTCNPNCLDQKGAMTGISNNKIVNKVESIKN